MGRRPRVSREDVLGAARDAFSERGYDGTTLAAISSRLGISPAALLRHAESKEALFAACMDPTRMAGAGPLEFLAHADPRSDPKRILRRVAHSFVPFVERKLSEDIVQFLHLRLDPHFRASGPRKVLGAFAGYLERATRAGRLRVKDPEATALAFMGSLQSYAFVHVVLRVFDPPFPLERYLDNLVDIWASGIVVAPKAKTVRTP
jgi:AcrR family transcriptional regulator